MKRGGAVWEGGNEYRERVQRMPPRVFLGSSVRKALKKKEIANAAAPSVRKRVIGKGLADLGCLFATSPSEELPFEFQSEPQGGRPDVAIERDRRRRGTRFELRLNYTRRYAIRVNGLSSKIQLLW